VTNIQHEPLLSWNDGTARRAIVDFVQGAGAVPAEERVAVFDNDGTLWCEKPMPIELGFILQRLAAMADQDPGLRGRQPWKAAYDKDYGWLGDVITKHYAGDDSDVKVLLGDLEANGFTTYIASGGGIWSRVGRRPILAAGNSNGDIPMLQFAGGPSRPGLRLLVLTTTPSASSTTWPGPSAPWSRRRRRGGRWSASGATGRPCSARGRGPARW